ncbi:MAG: hypothetical protein ABW195_15890 [Ilumatobacteraceae bacterium]
MTDELDDFEDEIEGEEAIVDDLVDEIELYEADDLLAVEAERDETPFDETRIQYSGVAADDSDVDIEEYEEAGALFDDPEKTTLLSGGMDDPDGADE